MRKKEALNATLALSDITIVMNVQAQGAARQNAPPGKQEYLAKQALGKRFTYYCNVAVIEKQKSIESKALSV